VRTLLLDGRLTVLFGLPDSQVSHILGQGYPMSLLLAPVEADKGMTRGQPRTSGPDLAGLLQRCRPVSGGRKGVLDIFRHEALPSNLG
jgi:hypothetical protein